MTTGAVDVAVVSSDGLRHLGADDRLFLGALCRAGLRARAVAWTDAAVRWERVRAAVIRSTWDYHERFDEFRAWIDHVAATSSLWNDRDTVLWNARKTYFRRLEAAGVAVVPTVYCRRGEGLDLEAILTEKGWARAIVKPVVSSTAHDTHRVSLGHQDDRTRFAALLAQQDMMVQPYLARVEREGEISAIFIAGELSHAVLKLPRPGDFRVQDDWGGTVHRVTPDPDVVAAAERAVAGAGRGDLLYARVDLVRDDEGFPRVIELELIEPELFLRYEPGSSVRLAHALAERLARN